jgi:hypothetical protein
MTIMTMTTIEYQRDQKRIKEVHYRPGDDYPDHEYDGGGDWNVRR